MVDVNHEQTCKDVVYLCKCALNGVAPDSEAIAAMDLDAVFAVASSHMVAAAVAMALQSGGCEDERVSEAIATSQRKTVIFDHALAGVKAGLEEAGIWYMPLKGAVLKGLYPKYGMREFADYDVLFDASRANDVKGIMEGLGFETEYFGHGNDDVYFKAPVLNFEMHRRLFDPNYDENFFNYFLDVKERLMGEGFERRFTHEDFYLYFLAHEHKHYVRGGTGLRSLLDTYVYLRAVELDEAYVAAEAEKLGIRDFEEQNRSLALHLFGGGELTGGDAKMLDYVLSSGVFGSIEHQVQNAMHENGGSKIRYMLKRFAVPLSEKDRDYDQFVKLYPFFYEHKALLPILPFYRVARSLKNGRFFAEAKAIKDSKRGVLPE